MKKIIIYISSGTFIIIVALLAITIYYSKVLYLTDSIRSYYIDSYEWIFSKNSSIKIINSDKYKRYKKTFNDLPNEFIHIGDFLLYNARAKTNLRDISHQAIKYTNYFNAISLTTAIRKYNSLTGNSVNTGQVLLIPGSLNPFILDPGKLKKPNIRYSKGLYFTGYSTGSANFLKKIALFKKYGINTVVFDAKDVTGYVNYKSKIKEVKKYKTDKMSSIDNIEMLIRELRKNNIYIIARVALFRDHLLAKKFPKLAIRSKRTGWIWNARSSELWCDPTNKLVQEYNINLAIELAEMGVDEIQFDYIRFPTAGNLKDAKYSYDFGKMSNEQVITHFLKRAYAEISSRNTLLSIDIFGVVAWGKKVDIRKTGQNIELLSQYCDVISPMLYPSHFNYKFDGFSNPADHPYYYIFNGCQKVIKLLKRKIAIRPWLQAFGWRVTNYNEQYIRKQIKASDDSGAMGYLMWNASNKYGAVYRALQNVNDEKKQN
ncbi:putative glycoside hydrolase [Spirochaetota bacterium]